MKTEYWCISIDSPEFEERRKRFNFFSKINGWDIKFWNAVDCRNLNIEDYPIWSALHLRPGEVGIWWSTKELFEFEILLRSPAFERIVFPFKDNLEKLGIEVVVRTIDTAQYQKKEQIVELGELSALNVPEWISRNTIMYSSKLFNRSLDIQTGVTFNYFTKFWANIYNPLISEFVVQNYIEVGEFPRFDLFFNAKIQQTRVFIKVEHLNSSFSGYDYYSDPFTPYRDLSVRFGLVWNFFQ